MSNPKTDKITSGGTNTPATPRKWYQSPNFYIQALSALLALGAFVTGSQITAFVAVIPAGIAIWNAFKDGGTLSILEWLGKANVRAYIAQALVIAVPALTSDFFNNVWAAIDAALGKNWSALLAALFSLVTIVYKLIVNRPTPPPAVG